MNCLNYALNYRIANKYSRIKIESHLIEAIKSNKFSLRLFVRYLKFIGIKDSLFVIFVPHFYILHDGEKMNM